MKTVHKYSNRRAIINLRLSEFEMPPMQDVLVIGKRAPIGPEAARRMADALSPEQFTIKRVDHAKIEAILFRKELLEIIESDVLVEMILEECESIVMEHMVLRSSLNIVIDVHREIDI